MGVTQIDYQVQALGRLAQQYVDRTKFRARVSFLAAMAQDLDASIQAFAGKLNVTTAAGKWLDIIGWLVGVARVLPNQDVLTDGPYRTLILAKIARNHCTADVPSMIEQFRNLFDPGGTNGTAIVVTDHGQMAMTAEIGRPLTDAEKSILAITSGISQIPGGILPKPMGVRLTVGDRASTGFFSFTDVDNPGVPLTVGGRGFSDTEDPASTTWAGVVI